MAGHPVASPSRWPSCPRGRATYALIHEGGPFPHDKDGSVFGNREAVCCPPAARLLPEYTVRTPGVAHRGARRIVYVAAPNACPMPAITPATTTRAFEKSGNEPDDVLNADLFFLFIRGRLARAGLADTVIRES